MTLRPRFDWTSGSPVSHTNLDKGPGGIVGYVSATADILAVTTGQTVLDLNGVTVESGRSYEIIGTFGDFWTSNEAMTVEARLFVDAAVVQKQSMYCSAAQTVWTPVPTLHYLYHSGASGTIDIATQVQISAFTATPSTSVYCGTDAPLLLWCKDLGPST